MSFILIIFNVLFLNQPLPKYYKYSSAIEGLSTLTVVFFSKKLIGERVKKKVFFNLYSYDTLIVTK